VCLNQPKIAPVITNYYTTAFLNCGDIGLEMGEQFFIADRPAECIGGRVKRQQDQRQYA
jgi:hypothetical protein